MDRSRFSFLLELYINKQCSMAEEAELSQLLNVPENQQEHLQVLGDFINAIPAQHLPGKPYADEVVKAILNANRDLPISTVDLKSAAGNLNSYTTDGELSSQPLPHRIHLLKTAWFRYAAVLLLIAGTATFLYKITHTPNELAQKISTPKPDILPGRNKAILTLSDGSTIVLDSAANGSLAQQGTTRIIKLDAGPLVYDNSGAEPVSGQKELYNAIRTPNGGQYHLVLPDGTGVWLNAASSITYPATFNGPDRRVKITGEAYLEVAKNKSKSFIVDVNGNASVEVLGTSFNINAYTNEPVIRTTLLDGRIKMIVQQQAAFLKPGQEALISDQKIKIIDNADLEMAVAWRSGSFMFDRTPIDEVLRQLSRWYDVEILFEKNIPAILFSGAIKRDLNLSQALFVLEKMGVNFKIEGKKLIVM